VTSYFGAVPAWAGEVSLRAVTTSDAPLLDGWHAQPALMGEFNDFGHLERPSYAERLAAGGLVGDGGGSLLVEAAGAPVGTVSWHRVQYGPNDESAQWNTGISLLPEARGRGIGWRAQRLLAERLLATTSVNRIEASTDVGNVAEQRSLEKAGFTREGVLRGAQHRAGAWHDIVSYSLLRADLDTPPPGAA
jgi:RimJ/RimL family protein N-acetyltransferase